MTLLVKRMEQRDWVVRARDAGDGRVALISLASAGAEVLQEFRADYRAVVSRRLRAMSELRLAELEAAALALGDLIEDLQAGGAG
jgi:DNA-binding MarR family transcriptional regulator